MNHKKSLSLIVATVLVSTALIQSAFAIDSKVMRASVLDAGSIESVNVNEPSIENVAIAASDAVEVTTSSIVSSEDCSYEIPTSKKYESQLVTVRRKLRVDTDEVFRVKVFLKNTGNMPWFSDESTCAGTHVSLGTDQPRDRNSMFYATSLEGVDDPNWEGANRVGMDQLRINPGQVASFTFYGKAPSKANIIKEYFTPVVEGVQWMEETSVSFEIIAGNPDYTSDEMRTRMLYANESGSVMDIPLHGTKSVLVDLSDQELFLKLDDYVVRNFRISSGAAKTPTPIGETAIKLKQEVRVGGKSPHYIMPKFMWFRAGGYGFHALPSLGNDNGVFWSEAWNHIGIPVSHGCVRLLPHDADFMFEFVEVGTKVVVQR
jgi:hypothetical protein